MTDLGLAYRKAKVDAYYSSVLVRSDFVEYEQDLISNLDVFNQRLAREPHAIPLGEWSLLPKSIEPCEPPSGVVHSCPEDRWAAAVSEFTRICNAPRAVAHSCPGDQWEAAGRLRGKTRPTAAFRLMAQPSVDFHLLSALWMLKVGHLYDAKLNANAYGNRLRRKQDGSVNPLSLGSFMPYLRPFREWRDNGIDALRTAIADGKKVVAVTADVGGFYHKLNPDFMLKCDFLDAINLKLNDEQRELTAVFVGALRRWARSTPLETGLPVGLPASGLVANMALIELDRAIEREVLPLYYGRYVDDIILVMEDTSNFANREAVWEWMFRRVNGLLRWGDKEPKGAVSFAPSYLSDSAIQFSNDKNKVFLIRGVSGKALVDSIAHHVHQRASEWRALPNLPGDPKHVATALVEATQNDGECADSLRKADSLSMRRAGFAIKLRDLEAYERDLPPDAWKEHRRAFLNAFSQHVLVLPKFFELADYLPRIIRLATACEDFALLRTMLDRLFALVERVSRDCETSIKSCPPTQQPGQNTIIEKWRMQLRGMVSDSVKASFPYRLSRVGANEWRKHMAENGALVQLLGFDLTMPQLKTCQEAAFVHDLAHIPFRLAGLPHELLSGQHLPPKRSLVQLASPGKILPSGVTVGVEYVAGLMRCKRGDGLPLGLLFATRPLSIQELYLLHPSPYAYTSVTELSRAILALRGFRIEKSMPCVEKNGVLQIPLVRHSNKYGIAVASWRTDIRSWAASATGSPEPDASRYARTTDLLNEVLASPVQIDYLIMPELSLPPGWFLRFAHKLHGRGISLISGVGYLHRPRKRVMNQVWAALPHNGLGFPSLALYRQDKQRPALHEERELTRVAGAVLQPERTWRAPPVLRHGDLQFAMLICSELTNISYRSALRGRVDALFVPEWNQDTESFNALVESAALDIHAYIVQCNDRQYGDSRIRVPHRDSWMRDHVRIKGGKNDYFVVGEIDVASLRAFQSGHRSPDGPFKPVPDGFECAFGRRVLPQTESGHK